MNLRTRLPVLTDRVPLARRGLAVSPVCIGLVRDPSIIVDAFDRGVNFFFLTADMHWPLYEGTRAGIRDLLRLRPGARDAIVVGAVSYVQQPHFTLAPFLEVLAEIPGLDRLDVVIAGSTGLGEAERLQLLRQHGPSGRIPGAYATGATFHDLEAAGAMTKRGLIDIAFARYNAAHRAAERILFPHVSVRSSLVFNFKSTAGYVPHACLDGMEPGPVAWRPTVADHYRFVLSNPEIDGVLCALSTTEELGLLDEALAAGPLTQEQISYMASVGDAFRGRARTRNIAIQHTQRSP